MKQYQTHSAAGGGLSDLVGRVLAGWPCGAACSPLGENNNYWNPSSMRTVCVAVFVVTVFQLYNKHKHRGTTDPSAARVSWNHRRRRRLHHPSIQSIVGMGASHPMLFLLQQEVAVLTFPREGLRRW